MTGQRPVSLTSVAKLSSPRRLAVVGLVALVFGAVAVSASTALAATDTIAPTKPATPTASPINYTTATVHVGGSTDNDRVAGYTLQRQVNGVWTDWNSTIFESSTYIYAQPLTPGTTYTVVVVAFDPSGNRSPRSDPLTFTTPAASAPTCRVMRQVTSPTTSMVTFFIDNMTAAPVTNWTANFTLPAAHTASTFNAVLTRSGDAATFRPAPNTAQVNPGSFVYFGFFSTRPANSAPASGFTVTTPATGAMTCSVT